MKEREILEESMAMLSELQSWRRALHRIPELEFDLVKTSAFVEQKLIDMGYKPQRVGKCGISVLAGGKRPGKVFLIRGDMDALPICEDSGVEYASEHPGCMHACGHDMHTSMMLGAAKILKFHEDEIEGTVKLMFQPGEETLTGAKDMIEAGILENPKVDAAMMIHVSIGSEVENGRIILYSGGTGYSSSDVLEIKIHGKSSHGAHPHQSIDPINAACHVFLALQTLNSREIESHEPFVLTIGSFQGGTACNQIPESVTLLGSIRTMSKSVREYVKERVAEIATSTAKAFKAVAEVNYGGSCPMAVCDPSLVLSARRTLTALFGEDGYIDREKEGETIPKINGSEDFGYVSERVPSVILNIGAGDSRKGYIYGVHHAKARFDDSCLANGSATYVTCAMNWLRENK